LASLIRWAARMFIPGLTSIYDSPTAIVNDLLSMGYSYRRQTMFRDVNEYLDIVKLGPSFSAFSRDRPTPDELYGRSWTFRRNERYQVTGLVELRDLESGEITSRYVTYYTDEKLTGDKELDELNDYLEGLERYPYAFRVVSFTPQHGKKNMRLDMFQE